MCLAVPMQVISIDGFMARCEAKGIGRAVSLFLMQHEDIAVGNHVMVHVGYAIQKMTAAQANGAWDLYDQMFEAEMRASADA